MSTARDIATKALADGQEAFNFGAYVRDHDVLSIFFSRNNSTEIGYRVIASDGSAVEVVGSSDVRHRWADSVTITDCDPCPKHGPAAVEALEKKAEDFIAGIDIVGAKKEAEFCAFDFHNPDGTGSFSVVSRWLTRYPFTAVRGSIGDVLISRPLIHLREDSTDYMAGYVVPQIQREQCGVCNAVDLASNQNADWTFAISITTESEYYETFYEEPPAGHLPDEFFYIAAAVRRAGRIFSGAEPKCRCAKPCRHSFR